MAKPIGMNEEQAFSARLASGFVTARDAQNMLSISFNTLQKWIREGRIHKKVLGSTVRYSVAEIQSLYENV